MNIADFIKGIGIFNLTSTRSSDGALVDSNGDPIVPIDVTWGEFTALDPADYDGVVIRISDKHGSTGCGGSFVVGDIVNNGWGQVSGPIDFDDYSGLPTASSYPGWEFLTTNIGIKGAKWKSVMVNDAYKYVLVNDCQLVETAIPVIYPPSGSVTAGGALTLGTSIVKVYPKCWIYLPASAISGATVDKMYYCEMSTVTAGTVYATGAVAASTTAFIPYIPRSPVAAVGSGAGYTTATASDKPMMRFLLPANIIGTSGKLEVRYSLSMNTGAGTETPTVSLGGTNLNIGQTSTSGNLNTGFDIQSRESLAWQFISIPTSGVTPFGTTTSGTVDTNIALSSNQDFIFNAKISSATEFLVYERLSINLSVNT